MTPLLEPLLQHLPAWLLVVFRLSGIFLMGPVFGSQVIPARVKVFFALGMSFCVYPLLLGSPGAGAAFVPPPIEGGLHLGTLAAKVALELAIGLLIGFGLMLPLSGMIMAGRVIDTQLGLAVASLFNPDVGEESGILSEVLYILALALFLVLGGHRAMLATLVGSFGHVPLGGFRVDGGLLDLLVGLVASMFELALRVSAPILCLIFLETVAMGFIARTVPQMNLLSIGFAIRILLGGVLLTACIAVFADVFEAEVLAVMEAVRQAVAGP